MSDRSWMSYIAPFGKHKNDTLQIIRMNDLQYVIWMSEQKSEGTSSIEFINKCKDCIEYLRETDPWSLEHPKRIGDE